MDRLPNGWIPTKVGEVANIVSGKTPKGIADYAKNSGEIPWVKVSDMNTPGNEEFVSASAISFSRKDCERLGLPILPAGSVIFPKNGGAIATGKRRVLGKECSIDLNTMGLTHVFVHPRLLYYWTNQLDMAALSDGSVVPQINKSDIAPINFDLPPANEQKRIAEKLDNLFTRSRAAREELTAVSRLIERYKQGILTHLFSGAFEPTAEYSEDTLGSLFHFNPKHPKETDRNIPVSFIPMPAVSDVNGCIQGHETRRLGDVWKGYTHFQNDDVIFAKITPCMENGKIAVAKDLKNNLACGSTEFHVLRSKGEILPEYLWLFLRQPNFRDLAKEQMTGAVGQQRVPADFLKNTKILYPSLETQKEIVRRIEKAFATIDAIATQTAAGLHHISHLEAQCLNKAFRGELVPQDPNDEPASVLIERIRTKTASAVPAKKAQKKAVKKKA